MTSSECSIVRREDSFALASQTVFTKHSSQSRPDIYVWCLAASGGAVRPSISAATELRKGVERHLPLGTGEVISRVLVVEEPYSSANKKNLTFSSARMLGVDVVAGESWLQTLSSERSTLTKDVNRDNYREEFSSLNAVLLDAPPVGKTVREWLVSVIGELNSLLKHRSFDTVDQLLRLNVSNGAALEKCVALLRASFAVRTQLPAWRDCYRQVKARLEADEGKDASRVLQGLDAAV